MIYNSFIEFMKLAVIPLQKKHPNWIRLDGRKSGGSRNSAGRFWHEGFAWTVHEDSHFATLELAYAAAKNGDDYFVEGDTDRGMCLDLTPELRKKYQPRFKHLYIYRWP